MELLHLYRKHAFLSMLHLSHDANVGLNMIMFSNCSFSLCFLPSLCIGAFVCSSAYAQAHCMSALACKGL